ncbi:MAG: AMP-binding protein [bacterium]
MKDTRISYRIAGRELHLEELKSLSLEKISVLGIPPWEREIWSFILQWFSPADSITVKTSGSTGSPAELSLQKQHMKQSAEATLSFLRLKRGDTALLCLPVKYIAGKMMVVRALVGGLDLILTEPASVPELDPLQRIHFAAMTPMQAAGLLDTEKGLEKLNRIDKLILGGGLISSFLEDQLQPIQTEIWQTYGMTETITHIALRKVNGKQRSEWYRPLPGVTVHTDETGRLIIDYPAIGIQGLVTGDLAVTTKGGQFKIMGRTGNVVNSGGLKLHPEVLEQQIDDLISVPYFLGGTDDNKLGQKLVMLLESENISEGTLKELKEKVGQRLTGHNKPRGYFLLPAFIRTENGKIRRQQTLNLLKDPKNLYQEF